MKPEAIARFKTWFETYYADNYGQGEYIDANLKLKYDHSWRVCGETKYLAGELELNENQSRIAYAIALFHDVGRFPQFIRYQTYHDPRSVNHCLLSLQVLAEHHVLDDIEPTEKRIIEKAIEYHGIKELPGDLDDDLLLYCRLIRDADKIDIYHVVLTGYAEYLKNPEKFDREIELPDEPWYTPQIYQAVLAGEKVDYARLQTLNDMKLLQLGWVYDMNFPATIRRIESRGHFDKILAGLPDNDEIRRLRIVLHEYIGSRCEL